MDVRKRNGRQTHDHEDRRPAGLAAAKRRLEIAGPSECQAPASVSIMTARSGIGGAAPHREEVPGVTRRDRALATSFSMTKYGLCSFLAAASGHGGSGHREATTTSIFWSVSQRPRVYP